MSSSGDKGSKEISARGDNWLNPPVGEGQKELRQSLDEAARRGADEVALRRVWARLSQVDDLVPGFEPRGRVVRRSRWTWVFSASVLGAATAAAITVLLVVPRSGEQVARVASSNVPAAAVGNRNQEKSVLLAPATVRTARGETLKLSLRGGTDVTLTPEATLSLDEDDRPTVSAGDVQFRVPPQPAGRIFTVAARQYRVVVVGTRFVVHVGASDTAVRVDEGVVEIWSDKRLARLRAGESWAKALETAETIDAAAPAAEPTKAAPAKIEAASLGASTKSPSIAARGEREATPLASPRSKSHRAFAPTSLTRGTSKDDGPRPAQNLALATPTTSTNSAPATQSSTAPALARTAQTPVTAPTATVSPEATNLLSQARAARSKGDARHALEIYRTLADRGGPAGENAEYEMGRILRDQLGQPRQAISTWRLYRAQHPRGLLRIESDISIIETLVSVNEKAGALAEASEFVRRYPEGERHAEMAKLVGDLSRERGNCRAAVDAYDEVLADSRLHRNVADDVTFSRSTCLLREDRVAGLEALQSYLRAFPAGRFRNQAQRLISEGPAPSIDPRE